MLDNLKHLIYKNIWFGKLLLDQPTLWFLMYQSLNLLVPFALRKLTDICKRGWALWYKSYRANIWLGHLGFRSSLQMWSQMFICSDLIWNVTSLRIWKVALSVNRLSSNRTLDKINTDSQCAGEFLRRWLGLDVSINSIAHLFPSGDFQGWMRNVSLGTISLLSGLIGPRAWQEVSNAAN